MYNCPNCKKALISQPGAKGISWVCESCGGRAVSAAVLRKTVGDLVVKEAWHCALETPQPSDRKCPVCAQKMLLVSVDAGNQQLALDLCRRCEFIWFDAGEYEAIPAAAPKPRVLGDINLKSLPAEAREKIAVAKVKDITEQGRIEDASPDEGWKSIPAFFGMPVELDSSEIKRFPWATWILAGIITAVSVPALFDLQTAVERYGLIPAEAWRDYGLTFFTAFFLHGGFIHLVGNLYFLIVFGRPVENFLGARRWLLLVFLAAIVGDLLHILFDPHGAVPCVGASGGISGLLVFYALKFPHARLGMIWRYAIIYYRWVQFPAWAAFFFWILLQSWGAYQQLHGLSNVSALAHFGGVAVGFLCWLVWRNLDALHEPGKGLFKVIG
jgi:membrane associated rhomboid family serine protease/ssDNA-binding Zn-finger/Zn-ribbon topoisomerase 1